MALPQVLASVCSSDSTSGRRTSSSVASERLKEIKINCCGLHEKPVSFQFLLHCRNLTDVGIAPWGFQNFIGKLYSFHTLNGTKR